jgi:putative SOS response-associated peptidase YedK
MLEIEHYYGVDDVDDLDIWERQFNIPPREMAPIVFERGGHRCLTAGMWSLLPPWAKGLEHVNEVSTFNAKAETLLTKPTFKEAFLKRRCIVPAEAFYEWVGPKRKRQPLHISRCDGNFLSMAGIYSFWKPEGSEGRPIPTFAVVTTEPNQWMARIHNRMPVILQDDQVETWLDPAVSDVDQLSSFLKAPPEDFLDCYPVDPKLINSARVDQPECINEVNVDWHSLLDSIGGSPTKPSLPLYDD